MIDENQVIDNRIIPLYVTGALDIFTHDLMYSKHSMFDPKN